MREGQARDRGCSRDCDERRETDAAGLIVTASLLLPALGLDGADGHLSGVGEGGSRPSS